MANTRSTPRETIISTQPTSNTPPSPRSLSPSPSGACLSSLPAEHKLAIVNYVLCDTGDQRDRDAQHLSNKIALWVLNREFHILTSARRWEVSSSSRAAADPDVADSHSQTVSYTPTLAAIAARAPRCRRPAEVRLSHQAGLGRI